MAQGGPVSVLDKRLSDPEAHLVRDRITRSRSLDREARFHSDDIDLRIPQCYRTSFSAVATPVRSARGRSRSKSPNSSSCLKYRRDMSDSVVGSSRKGGKHVTYSERVVVRDSDASETLNLSDRSRNRSKLGADMSDSSSCDYSTQLRELSQQIVQEYSHHDTSTELSTNSNQYHESKVTSAEVNGVFRPTNGLHVLNENSSRKRIVVEEDYDHDRSVSYRVAVNNTYSDGVKKEAVEVIEKATQSGDLNTSMINERRNSLPSDIQVADKNKLDSSKRSISSSISNFFRRLSPHVGRRNKKGSLSNVSSQSLSQAESLDGPLHKQGSSSNLSRGKLRRSFMKLIGKSPSKKDAKAKKSESSECIEKNVSNECQPPRSALYMKSIEQSSKSDVYQMFKDKQSPSRSATSSSSPKPQAMKASPHLTTPDYSITPDRTSVRKQWLEGPSAGKMTGDKCDGDHFTGNEPALLSQLPDSKKVDARHETPEVKDTTPDSTEPLVQAATVTPVSSPARREGYKSCNKTKETSPSSPPITVAEDFLEVFAFDTPTRTPSYLRISSAVSGYGHYCKYSAYRGIEKRSPYSSTLSLRSSRSDLATPLSPVEMPIGKIPNIQRPTNYPPLKTEILSPRTETFNDSSVETVTPVNGVTERCIQSREDSSSSLMKSDDCTIEGNGHIELVENFTSTGNPDKDAEFFLSVAQAEENRLLGLFSSCEEEMCSNDVPEEGRGKMRSAVGKANLLISRKFRQFQDLCMHHKCPTEGAKPTKWEDLQGFWEMVKLQVDDVNDMFTEIDMLRNNAWIEIKVPSRRSSSSSRSSPKSNSLNVSNASTPSHTPGSKRRAQRMKETPESSPERNQKAKMASKERNDARKKLLAEKRAALKQQQEQQQQQQDIESYVPDNGHVSESPELEVDGVQSGSSENDINGTGV